MGFRERVKIGDTLRVMRGSESLGLDRGMTCEVTYIRGEKMDIFCEVMDTTIAGTSIDHPDLELAPAIAVGATVRCAYRPGHVGIVLAMDDVRAWAGTLAFPDPSPDPVAIAAHIARHAMVLSAERSVPVLYPFGVRWDRELTVQS